jgi:hypothetical protein
MEDNEKNLWDTKVKDGKRRLWSEMNGHLELRGQGSQRAVESRSKLSQWKKRPSYRHLVNFY